jgi:hypothetical protein
MHMRHLFISSLAVAAFGVTLMGATTADADPAQTWVSSNWQAPGQNLQLTTPRHGFSVNYWTNWGNAGWTVAQNLTGTEFVKGASNSSFCSGQYCQTSFWTLAACNDLSIVSGNEANGGTPNSATSWTGDVGAYGAGYTLANGKAGTDTGVCPAASGGYAAGGVWVDDYF